MIKFLFSPLIFIVFLINPLFCGAETGANSTNIYSIIPSTKALLLQVPKSKGTVGMVPYVMRDNDLYILLGRERADGPKEKAGMYCDLGRSLKLDDGSRVIDNLIRELREESCGVFNLREREEDILQKGKLLYKESDTGREIYYLFYPLSDEEYVTADFLKHTVENSPEKGSEYLKKDEFMWVNIQDLLNADNHKKVTVRDIQGNEKPISLRPFFYNDFCKHEQLAETVNQIITNNSDSVCEKRAVP